MYKAVIFDFFGVFDLDLYDHWLKENGYSRTGKFAEIVKGMDDGTTTNETFFHTLGTLSGQDPAIVKQQMYGYSVLNDEMVSIVKILRQNHYSSVLLSNANTAFIYTVLNKHGIAPLFDEIIISSEIGFAKPSKEIFDYTLQKLKADHNEVIFIDDRRENIQAAERLGIKSLVFTNAEKLKHELECLGITLS